MRIAGSLFIALAAVSGPIAAAEIKLTMPDCKTLKATSSGRHSVAVTCSVPQPGAAAVLTIRDAGCERFKVKTTAAGDRTIACVPPATAPKG